MAIDNFIPQIWSARYANTVVHANIYGALCNRNYEGEITGAGDTVKIPFLTDDIVVRDYQRNMDIADPQVLNDSDVELEIDQQKYFNFAVDDVDQVQSRPELIDRATLFAGRKTAVAQDQFLAGVMSPTAGRAANQVVVPADAAGPLSKEAQLLISMIELRTRMKEGNFPADVTPFIVFPPRVIAQLDRFLAGLSVAGDSLVQSNGTYGSLSEDEMRNGFRGTLQGLGVRESNSVPFTNSGNGAARIATYRCPAGSLDAVTLAEQITQIEAYRPEKRFSDAIKGLYVYGAKLYNPDFLYWIDVAVPNPA